MFRQLVPPNCSTLVRKFMQLLFTLYTLDVS